MLKNLLVEEVAVAFGLLEQLEAHLEVIPLEFDEVVN